MYLRPFFPFPRPETCLFARAFSAANTLDDFNLRVHTLKGAPIFFAIFKPIASQQESSLYIFLITFNFTYMSSSRICRHLVPIFLYKKGPREIKFSQMALRIFSLDTRSLHLLALLIHSSMSPHPSRNDYMLPILSILLALCPSSPCPLLSICLHDYFYTVSHWGR